MSTKLMHLILLASMLIGFSCSLQNNPEMTNNNNSKQFEPPVNYAKATEWANSMVAKMTLEEKAQMIGGQEIFYTQEVPRLSIPKVMFTDASQGIHLRDSFQEYTYERPIDSSTAMPCPILLASTWNKNLAMEYAKAIGEECQAAGIPVLLGPGMNIYRISQCGRNFEYLGEDPYLAAQMVENYVLGLQNTGTIATLKHFVANNTDYYRRKSNSLMDARTLNEIYLPAFKAGIDAGAMAVMTSYNLIDGEWAGESENVINELLRKQLGFKWLVMTDWWSVFDGEKVIKSGQDLEMPARLATKEALELVKSGKIKEQDIDRMVASQLKTLYAMNAYSQSPKPELLAKLPEHEQTALNVAREGIVLLKNSNGLLPVSTNTKSILVTGPYANMLAIGGGSATVEGYNQIKLLEALEKEFGAKINYKENPEDKEIRNAELVFLCIGTEDSEGWDRSFDLPKELEELTRKTTTLNKNVVVLVNSGSGINMSHWSDKAGAILYSWYPGQNGNVATAEILSGKVNPSGKLPCTIERAFKDSPGFGYIPEGETLYTGWNDEAEAKRGIYDLNYNEGIFVGYRWYEKKNISPLFAFGHGLSYTSFNWNNLAVSEMKNGQVEVSFSISNSGKLEGAEVAQVYVRDTECSFPRPIKELKAFQKVKLSPGESQTLTFSLNHQDFAFWHPEKQSWWVEEGKFEIFVGSASDKLFLKQAINIQSE